MVKVLKNMVMQNPWEAFIVFLLGIVIAMGGWYVNRLTQIQDEQGKLISHIHLGQDVNMRIMLKDSDTGNEDKEELRTWLYPTRSGATKNQPQ